MWLPDVQHTTGEAQGGGFETHQHHRDSFTTKSYVQSSWNGPSCRLLAATLTSYERLHFTTSTLRCRLRRQYLDWRSLCAVIVSIQQNCIAVAAEQPWHLWLLVTALRSCNQFYVVPSSIAAEQSPVLYFFAIPSLSVKIAVQAWCMLTEGTALPGNCLIFLPVFGPYAM